MKTSLSRWGNSLAVRIPRTMALEIGVSDGSDVEMEVVDGGLLLRPVDDEPSLEELVAGITDENRHPEVSWGPPRGREVW